MKRIIGSIAALLAAFTVLGQLHSPKKHPHRAQPIVEIAAVWASLRICSMYRLQGLLSSCVNTNPMVSTTFGKMFISI